MNIKMIALVAEIKYRKDFYSDNDIIPKGRVIFCHNDNTFLYILS